MSITTQRGAIPIGCLDKPRILFYDMAATWLLVAKYGVHFAKELYAVHSAEGGKIDVTLKSPEALVFFLWVGLKAEGGRELTEDEVASFIRPWNIKEIFNTVVLAVTGATATPALPGKSPAVDATAESSATAQPKTKRRRVSTSRRPSATPTAR